MPTKKQKTIARVKAGKKTTENKTLLLVVAIAIALAILITGYIFFRRAPDTATDSPSKKAEEAYSGGENAPVAGQGFQAAVEKAKLQLESFDNKDIMKIIVEKTFDSENREITYTYEWSINGQPAGSGSDSLSGFKRGDKVAVKITPFADEKSGQPRSLVFDVQNTTPKVSLVKEPKFDGKTFVAQVGASDPDGDMLSYELVSGPEGMVVDKKSGMINWTLKEDKEGDYPVKVKISDGHGGEITYELIATIPKELPPPVAVPKKTP